MPLTQQAATIIDAFGQHPGVAPEHLNNLRQTIDASQTLTDQINSLVEKDALRRITPSARPGNDFYDRKTREVQLSLDHLSTSPSGAFNSAYATLVLGHELRHATDLDARTQNEDKFRLELVAVAMSQEREHDYTVPIGRYLSEIRTLEAQAEISGWNALISTAYEEAQNKHLPDPTLSDIYQKAPRAMRHFVDIDDSRSPAICTIKPNLKIDDRLYIASSEQNLEGMGRNYFDASTRLGHYSNSSYANYYGACAVSNAAKAERIFNPRHDVRIDLAKLRLNPRTLAENGISFGDDKTPIAYIDKSMQPPVRDLLRDTMASHIYYPDIPLIDTFHHPGHQLYLQAMSAIGRIEEQEGFPLRGSRNLAAVLAVSARRAGMDAIDHLHVQGNQVYGIQGNPYAVTKKVTAAVEKDIATRTFIEKSTMDWHALRTAPREQLQTQEQPARMLHPLRR